MAATVKDNQVTFEDQQKINTFARTSAHLMDLKIEMTEKKKELENLTSAEEELILFEADADTVPKYKIGEVLTEMSVKEALAELEKAKITCHSDISNLVLKAESYKQAFKELKRALSARFGSTVNLDLEDDIC